MWRDFTMSSRRESHSQSPSTNSSSSFGSYQTKSTSEFHKNNVPQLLNAAPTQQQQLIINGQQRSSYSLPHPAHMQSNARWQNLHHHEQNAMMQQQQRSTLMHSPSYPHIPSSGGDQHLLHGSGGRPRPVSMYDTPPSNGNSGGGGGGFSFIPNLLMPNRNKSSAAQVPMSAGYNGSAPASLQHQFFGKQQQQQAQPKKGQIRRQSPGELVRLIERGCKRGKVIAGWLQDVGKVICGCGQIVEGICLEGGMLGRKLQCCWNWGYETINLFNGINEELWYLGGNYNWS